jgi:hypothetical protein
MALTLWKTYHIFHVLIQSLWKYISEEADPPAVYGKVFLFTPMMSGGKVSYKCSMPCSFVHSVTDVPIVT